MHYFSFKHEHVEMLNDRLHYVVSFRPMVSLDYPLYSGLLYIDLHTLCITRSELSLDVSDKDKANKMLLQKKPAGLRFSTREASVVVTYRQHGERMFLDYIKSTIRFKCDWKRRLFSSAYTAVDSESIAMNGIVRAPFCSTNSMLTSNRCHSFFSFLLYLKTKMPKN